MSDDLGDRLVRELIAHETAKGVWGTYEIVAALLPVVLAERETYAAQRAAEELRAAADGLPCWCEHAADYGVSCLRHGTANEELHARAAALAATPDADDNETARR